jgi:hypothetical protein
MGFQAENRQSDDRVPLEIFAVWKDLPGKHFRKTSCGRFIYKASIEHITKNCGLRV